MIVESTSQIARSIANDELFAVEVSYFPEPGLGC